MRSHVTTGVRRSHEIAQRVRQIIAQFALEQLSCCRTTYTRISDEITWKLPETNKVSLEFIWQATVVGKNKRVSDPHRAFNVVTVKYIFAPNELTCHGGEGE